MAAKTNDAADVATWTSTSIYTAGMMVLEDGILYEANWWTQGNDPSANEGGPGSGQPWTVVSSTTSTSGVVPSTPTAVKVSNITSSTATLSWSPASVPNGGVVTGYAVFENGQQVAKLSATTLNLTSLNANTTYSFTVAALDTAGSSAQSAPVTMATPAGLIPSAPTGLADADVTSTSVLLSWTAPATPVGATLSGYTILENGQVVGTTANTSFTLSNLSAATKYSLVVEAADQYGLSNPSAALTLTTAATTPPAGNVAAWLATAIYTSGMKASEAGEIYQANWWTQDNDPVDNNGPSGSGEVWTAIGKLNTAPTVPDAPTNLDAAATSPTSASLFWTAATVEGSGTVSSYAVFANGTQIGTATTTNYTATGLASSQTYNFTVEAIDQTGASAPSAAAAVTLPAAGTQIQPTATFSPYIDISLYGNPSLVSIAEASGIKDFTLAFLQSSGPNTLGWAGTGTLADDALPDGSTILSQVQALRAIGGNVTISIGGAAGTDPASASSSAAALQAQYQSVIDRYGVTSLDFDIEGAQVANQPAIDLRDQALINLETVNPGLKISFTLPVLPTGLDNNGVNVLHSAAAAGVRIDVVNIMAMDYGGSQDNGGAMGTDAIDAIQATEHQIAAAGLTAKVGVTPMIGVNDIASEIFTLADAQQLASYVQTDSNVAQVAMWSVARDNGAGAGQTYASPNTSGVAETPYQFAGILQHA